MYFSKIYLNTEQRDTIRAFYNPAIFHGALERCFSGERQHPLWRIDKSQNGGYYILSVSHGTPNFSAFQKQFGYVDRPAQVKGYDAFLERGFQNGDFLRFRLVANPCICKDGHRIPLNLKATEKRPYSGENWIRDRLALHGAAVLNLEIISLKEQTAESRQRKIRFTSAECEGILKVTDREKLNIVLARGIGHEKAFGCGMLTVARMA